MTRAEFAQRLGGVSWAGGAVDPMVIEERSPERFRRAFADAAAGVGPVFLANPDWGSAERAEFAALVEQAAMNWDTELGWLMIPTGGTSGGVKLARHDQQTISSAVSGFRQFFDVDRINAAGVLPLHHVGGLMGWLRCALSGGRYRDVDWNALKSGQFPEAPEESQNISLVATQLKELLGTEAGRAWLRTFENVLLGGSAFASTLLQEARLAGVCCVPGYGSTETMAMMAARRPEELGDGANLGFDVLPHFRIASEKDERLTLSGASLFRGYWPAGREAAPWISMDRGMIDAEGRLQVFGRIDDLIITGGEKVNAAEIERVISGILPDLDLAVVGIPDEKWGHAVVACFRGDGLTVDRSIVEAEMVGRLAKFKWPKVYVRVPEWPVGATGKLNRRLMRDRAIEAIKHLSTPKEGRAE